MTTHSVVTTVRSGRLHAVKKGIHDIWRQIRLAKRDLGDEPESKPVRRLMKALQLAADREVVLFFRLFAAHPLSLADRRLQLRGSRDLKQGRKSVYHADLRFLVPSQLLGLVL